MFACSRSLKIKRCRSPPLSFNFKFWNWMEVNALKETAKCFIKIGKGLYEEISLKDLKKRINNSDTYRYKKFIPIHRNAFRSWWLWI